jgi:drug/metabolite transporter (DMT)-like permease
MNKKVKIIFAVLMVLFGIFMIVFGESDDSPGAQGLGLIAVIVGIVIIVKDKKRASGFLSRKP